MTTDLPCGELTRRRQARLTFSVSVSSADAGFQQSSAKNEALHSLGEALVVAALRDRIRRLLYFRPAFAIAMPSGPLKHQDVVRMSPIVTISPQDAEDAA